MLRIPGNDGQRGIDIVGVDKEPLPPVIEKILQKIKERTDV